jgi:hypothetical protein
MAPLPIIAAEKMKHIICTSGGDFGLSCPPCKMSAAHWKKQKGHTTVISRHADIKVSSIKKPSPLWLSFAYRLEQPILFIGIHRWNPPVWRLKCPFLLGSIPHVVKHPPGHSLGQVHSAGEITIVFFVVEFGRLWLKWQVNHWWISIHIHS